MKPKDIVVGNLYQNEKYPNSLYLGVIAPDGRQTFKLVKSEELLGKFVVYEEEIPLCMDFWDKFSPSTSTVTLVPSEEKSSAPARSSGKSLNLPDGEFSCKELAEQNSVEYPIAFVFIKEQVAAGKIEKTRTERRAARGKETQLFKKTELTSSE